jgi:hypothetical protein
MKSNQEKKDSTRMSIDSNSSTKENLSQRLSKRLSRITELTNNIQSEETIKRDVIPLKRGENKEHHNLRESLKIDHSQKRESKGETILPLSEIKKRASISPNIMLKDSAKRLSSEESTDITSALNKR